MKKFDTRNFGLRFSVKERRGRIFFANLHFTISLDDVIPTQIIYGEKNCFPPRS
jgi:hypothetical protein